MENRLSISSMSMWTHLNFHNSRKRLRKYVEPQVNCVFWVYIPLPGASSARVLTRISEFYLVADVDFAAVDKSAGGPIFSGSDR